MQLKKAFWLALLGLSCAHASLYRGTPVRLLGKDLDGDGGIEVLIEERDTNSDGSYDLELHYFIKGFEKGKPKLSEPIFSSRDNDYDGEIDELVMRCGKASARYGLAALGQFRKVELYFVLQNINYAGICYTPGNYRPRIVKRLYLEKHNVLAQRWDLDGDGDVDLVTLLSLSPEAGALARVCPIGYEIYDNEGRPVATFFDSDVDCIVDGVKGAGEGEGLDS